MQKHALCFKPLFLNESFQCCVYNVIIVVLFEAGELNWMRSDVEFLYHFDLWFELFRPQCPFCFFSAMWLLAILLNLDQNLDFIYFMVFSHMQVFSLHKYRNTVYKERTEFYVSWAQYLTFAWYFLIPYYTDSTYPNKSLMESLN